MRPDRVGATTREVRTMAHDAYGRRDADSTGPADSGVRGDSRFGGHSPYQTEFDVRSSGSMADFPIGGFRSSDQIGTRRIHPDDVFDDPDQGEPGRDRMRVHVWWEILLLLGVVALTFLIHGENPEVLFGAGLSALLVSATAVGLLALAAGMTLRAGAPNLAIGSVAIVSALHFAEQGDQGVAAAVWPAVLAATVLGLVLALLVVGLHVPAWAASLGAALALVVLIEQRPGPVEVQGGYDPTQHAVYLFGGLAAVTVLGGLFGAVKTIRRAVGRFRPVADPALRRGAGAAALVTVVVTLSTIFAMLAGVLLAAGGPEVVQPSTGFEWTGLAMGAALLGGTSAFGRRGGVFGTLLCVVLLTLFTTYADQRAWGIATEAAAAVAIGVGLVLTRLVERFGRPQPWDGDEGQQDRTATSRWGGDDRQESWSSALPAQPTDSRADTWARDRWGGTDR